MTRIVLAKSLADAVAGADIVIEAVREDLATKLTFSPSFAAGARCHPGDELLVPSVKSVAPAVDDPERFLNMHFFAPVWIRPMLELMGCGATRRR